MKKLALLLFLVGCGSTEEQTAVTPLSNTTWSTPATTQRCGAAVSYGADDYTWTNVCIEADGSVAAYMERGSFRVDGDHVTNVARESTCLSGQIVTTLTDAFSVSDGALTLSGGHGALYLPSGTGSTGARIGCFEPGGSFVERAIAPL